MFILFAENKLKYKKGQIAPFFILILVAVLIMAMVTVNLSKVASIKTESGNAADAGSIAAGSVMAKTFNVLAQANSQLEAYYEDFLVSTMAMFAAAFVYLGMAVIGACSNPCTAKAALSKAMYVVSGIATAVTAYWVASQYFYCKIRETGEKGRESAIGVGHQFVFLNSGIGSKLKKAQRDDFRDYLKEIEGAQEERTYSWADGQGRAHSVKSQVHIDEIEDYDLRTSAIPYATELTILAASIALLYSAREELEVLCDCFTSPMYFACGSLCIPAVVAIAAAISILSGAVGITPISSISSSSCSDTLFWIVAWIDDINHNRLVKVDTWQTHEGADLGLWQTSYPDTHTFSWTDFRGSGSIYPPRLRHDASMTKTDELGAED